MVFITDRFDQSEDKLVNLVEMKKIEVSQHIARVIDQLRQLEDEFHNEIDEFKNNRLAYVSSSSDFIWDMFISLSKIFKGFFGQHLRSLKKPTRICSNS